MPITQLALGDIESVRESSEQLGQAQLYFSPGGTLRNGIPQHRYQHDGA
jgi:hypothetical protein